MNNYTIVKGNINIEFQKFLKVSKYFKRLYEVYVNTNIFWLKISVFIILMNKTSSVNIQIKRILEWEDLINHTKKYDLAKN